MKPIVLGLTLALLAACASSPITNAVPASTATVAGSAATQVAISDFASDIDATMPDLSGTAIHSFGIDAVVNGKRELGYVNAVRTCYVNQHATNCVLIALKTQKIKSGVVGLFTGKDATGRMCAEGPIEPGTYHPFQKLIVAYRWTGQC